MTLEMLEVRRLQTYYGDSHVLHGIDLDVAEGEVVALLGRNGMGKTTTINSIMGIVKPRAGEIRLNGLDIAFQQSYKIARAGIAIVPEGRLIFPNLTVAENLVAMRANRSGSDKPWTLDRIYDLFPPLVERRNQLGTFLSGGEQQMLAIGRALMTNPKLLILDEATEGVAPILRNAIWACLRKLRELGQATLIVDKKHQVARRIGRPPLHH